MDFGSHEQLGFLIPKCMSLQKAVARVQTALKNLVEANNRRGKALAEYEAANKALSVLVGGGGAQPTPAPKQPKAPKTAPEPEAPDFIGDPKGGAVWRDDGNVATLKREIRRLNKAGCNDIEIAKLLGRSVKSGKNFKRSTIERLRKEMNLRGLAGRPAKKLSRKDFNDPAVQSATRFEPTAPEDLKKRKWPTKAKAKVKKAAGAAPVETASAPAPTPEAQAQAVQEQPVATQTVPESVPVKEQAARALSD